MLKALAEVKEAFMLGDDFNSYLVIKLDSGEKATFVYPPVVHWAQCVDFYIKQWKIVNSAIFLSAEEKTKHRRDAFRNALTYYKIFLPFYNTWKLKNFPS
jgi:hypothetical protein